MARVQKRPGRGLLLAVGFGRLVLSAVPYRVKRHARRAFSEPEAE